MEKKKVLNRKGRKLRDEFDGLFRDEVCTCMNGTRCNYCEHPGNHRNLKLQPDVWAEIDLLRVKGSSAIVAAGYDLDEQLMGIKFKSGHVSAYTDVPAGVYLGFLEADSFGVYFHSTIKGKYPNP